MNDIVMAAFIMLAMNAELIECTEIKRTIIIRQINGKTVVYGLDKVESNTLKESKDSNQEVKVEIKATTTNH